MAKFRVTPKSRGKKAPYMIVEATSAESAAKQARSLSGLGRFENWGFYADELHHETGKLIRRKKKFNNKNKNNEKINGKVPRFNRTSKRSGY